MLRRTAVDHLQCADNSKAQRHAQLLQHDRIICVAGQETGGRRQEEHLLMPPHSAKTHSAPWCPQSQESLGQPSWCAWHGGGNSCRGRQARRNYLGVAVRSTVLMRGGTAGMKEPEEWRSQGFTPAWDRSSVSILLR